MSDWKGIVKKGWHPEKPGTTFKSQMVRSPISFPSMSCNG